MNKYEALIILAETLKDQELEEALGKIRDEIVKLGGEVQSTTRLGKRGFARIMKKKEAGHYALLAFTLVGGQISPLQARLKLQENVFRVQVVCAPPPVAPRKKAAAGGESAEVPHGVAQ